MTRPENTAEITVLLKQVSEGQQDALPELMVSIESELRRRARLMFLKERQDHTLQPTALVNEAFLRLTQSSHLEFADRKHFFLTATRVMGNILTDHARRRLTAKRGGDLQRVEAEALFNLAAPQDVETYASLSMALDKLENEDVLSRQAFELTFLGGLEQKEVSELLDTSERTIRRKLQFAKRWLARELAR